MTFRKPQAAADEALIFRSGLPSADQQHGAMMVAEKLWAATHIMSD